MRSSQMLSRILTLLALPAMAFPLAACERRQPEPQPAATASAPAPSAAPSPEATPSPSAQPPAQSDEGKAADRLLRSYAEALQARDWNRAAGAWGNESGVTAAILKAAYDRPERPTLEIGRAEVEGAAGSLYYEAPVVLRFGGADAPPERGTLTLRRVNDVPGATPEQRRWHIERATIGVGQ